MSANALSMSWEFSEGGLLRDPAPESGLANKEKDRPREDVMRRRDLLKATGASLAALAAPRIGRAERASKLVFVPPIDLTILDPVVTGLRSTRNHAYLVFDTLYGIDTNWAAQPQMVEGHQIEEDGLTWLLTLRDGLCFHDKEPVLARDVIASIRRFAARISFADALMTATDELSAPDDRTVRFRLKRPFPHLPEALAGPGAIVPAIMPERLAATSAFKPVAEIVGSGPYRFLAEEHVSGARAAYERFALYQPRSDGAVGFTSGPKVAHFDRVEWLTLDQFSAMAALRNGEIDWWEIPPNDLVEGLTRDRNLTVISQYATAMGILRLNHLHPPFNNAVVRRALLGAIDQAEAMIALAGADRAFWHDGIGLFGAGTPLANDAGIEVTRGPRDYMAVRQALARAGYNGEKIVVLAPTDAQPIRALSLVGSDQLRRAGMNVDLQEMELATATRRRFNQSAPDKGGWSAFFGLLDRSVPNTNPYGNMWLRADGLAAWDGWPTSFRIEALRAAWLDAGSLNEQRRICEKLQMQLWEDVPYIPMGEYWQATAYRKDLLDVLPGCFAVFYGVRRA
jgi:peptide/nickel transport system substrate-binding protein